MGLTLGLQKERLVLAEICNYNETAHKHYTSIIVQMFNNVQ